MSPVCSAGCVNHVAGLDRGSVRALAWASIMFVELSPVAHLSEQSRPRTTRKFSVWPGFHRAFEKMTR